MVLLAKILLKKKKINIHFIHKKSIFIFFCINDILFYIKRFIISKKWIFANKNKISLKVFFGIIYDISL